MGILDGLGETLVLLPVVGLDVNHNDFTLLLAQPQHNPSQLVLDNKYFFTS